jgi:hypothetical protein
VRVSVTRAGPHDEEAATDEDRGNDEIDDGHDAPSVPVDLSIDAQIRGPPPRKGFSDYDELCPLEGAARIPLDTSLRWIGALNLMRSGDQAISGAILRVT